MMKTHMVALLVVVGLSGCSKKQDVCERYAEVAQKCANPQPKDPVLDRKISMDVCSRYQKKNEQSERGQRELKGKKLSLPEEIRKMADCAATSDCVAFNACIEAVKIEAGQDL